MAHFGRKQIRTITHSDLEEFKLIRLQTPVTIGKNGADSSAPKGTRQTSKRRRLMKPSKQSSRHKDREAPKNQWRGALGGFLLGLIRAHRDVKEQELLTDFSDGEKEPLNTGIAIVTPIKEALSIINGNELVKERRRLDRLRAAEIGKT